MINKVSFKTNELEKRNNNTIKQIATNAVLAVPLTAIGIIGYDIFEGGFYHPKRDKNITFKEYFNDVVIDLKKNFKVFENKTNKAVLSLYVGSIYAFCFAFLSAIRMYNKKSG